MYELVSERVLHYSRYADFHDNYHVRQLLLPITTDEPHFYFAMPFWSFLTRKSFDDVKILEHYARKHHAYRTKMGNHSLILQARTFGKTLNHHRITWQTMSSALPDTISIARCLELRNP